MSNPLALLALIASSARAAAGDAIYLSPAAASRPFHGHGALSAGASSRLLHDYEEPMRSDLLDYLFKPQWGAEIQLLKIEIGGDTQSTDGTEPSHQHYRDEPSRCGRGYEAWLASEARKRNPDVSVYALSWGVPGWVGNGSTSDAAIGVSYCSNDNIQYQTAWVTCMETEQRVPIDYIGVWNEMTWCGTEYVLALRAALDGAGHASTTIVLPDGGYTRKDLQGRQYKDEAQASAELRQAAPIMGFHYPCGYPDLQINETMSSWASEDFSSHNLGNLDPHGGPGWTSGSYWGRLLNQNFVRMNMTTTIAWALIWSVLPGLGCEGDGLTLANSPWSGHYEVDAAIWTTAHWTQFIKPGWRLLSPGQGQGSGLLPKGGSYVTAVSIGPAHGQQSSLSGAVHNFSVVIETLQGAGAGQNCKLAQNTTESQTVSFSLSQELAAAVPPSGLSFWRTTAGALFVEQPKVLPSIRSDGTATVELTIGVDAMYTLTTVQGGFHGRAAAEVPAAQAFALPYSESFDSYENDSLARFFTDQGGSFSVAKPDGAASGISGSRRAAGNGVLWQWTREPPGKNSWGGPKPSNPPPVTLVGGEDWQSYEACVDASTEGCVGSAPDGECYVMVCAHATSFATWSGWPPSSVCLQLNHSDGADTRWGVVAYRNLPAQVVSLAHGQREARRQGTTHDDSVLSSRRLCIATSGCGNISASLDGEQLLPIGFTLDSVAGLVAGSGRVALGSGWHTASFDNLTVVQTPVAPGASKALFQCVTPCNGTQPFVGFVGGLLTMRVSRNISSLARFCTASSPPAMVEAGEVVIAELKSGEYEVISSTTVVLKPGCEGADESGFVWSDLPAAVALQNGKSYVLATQNKPGWEFLGLSGDDMPSASGSSADVAPIYTRGTAAQVKAGTAKWIESGAGGYMYGPVNAR